MYAVHCRHQVHSCRWRRSYLPVNIGDLMYKSVSLGALQNFQNFLLCDVMAFSCFYQIICHITDTDAQISFDFAAAFAAHALLTAAGTGADCIFVLIFFQPVGDMLHTCGFLLCRNCLFYRNDMHSDSGASRRYHWCNLFQTWSNTTISPRSQLGFGNTMRSCSAWFPTVSTTAVGFLSADHSSLHFRTIRMRSM